MANKTVVIDLVESDIEMFEQVIHRGLEFSWVFPTEDGEDINIKFVPTKEDK